MLNVLTKKRDSREFGRFMLKILAISFIAGFAMMFIKNYMLNNGMKETWSVINMVLFQDINAKGASTALGIFYIIQTVFINALQFAIVPLVITSLSLSMCTLNDLAKLGRIAIKTIEGFLLFYLGGGILAIIVAKTCIAAGWFNATFSFANDVKNVAAYSVANPLLIILKFVPGNMFAPMSNNSSILAVIFIALTLGLSINICGPRLKIVKSLMEDLNEIINTYLNFVVNKCGPVCIFCMIVRTFSVYGWDEITPLLHYMSVTIVTLVVYWLLAYPLIVGAICKVNPIKFLVKTFKVGMFAFSVNSSAATLPLNRRTCIEELGCSESISDFVLPTGMTINMNGTAIEHIIAVSFIATVAHQDISLVAYITILLLAIGSAAGTPAIPNAGTVMIYATMTGAGFSSELCIMIYVMLLTLNKPVDMTVTSLNVVGDAATNCLVCNSEGELNKEVYNS